MTIFTRRGALGLGLSGVATALVNGNYRAFAQVDASPLPIPDLIEPDDQDRILLELMKGKHAFSLDAGAVGTWGISGSYLGPVLRVRSGAKVRMEVANRLDEASTLHWHGLMVPSELDGGPHNPIEPGAVWKPELTIRQAPSTAWFHPHLHQETARQTYNGLAGMLIVEDGGDRERGLPTTYGTDDLPIVIQDRRFAADGSYVYSPDIMDLMHGFRGETIIVNGAVSPLARVPKGVVRLRLLNGANARNFVLSLSGDRTINVVASDGGYLAKPVALSQLRIAPGERYEVLVDFKDGRPADLVSLPEDTRSMPMMAGMKGMAKQTDPVPLMRFQPIDGLKIDIARIPDTLENPKAANAAASVRRRSFVFDEMSPANMPLLMQRMGSNSGAMQGMGGMDGMPGMKHGAHAARSASEAGPTVRPAESGLVMAIAGKPFAMDRIDATVKLGSLEIWEIQAQEMAHPFHIHGATFRVLSRDGSPPPPHEAGWKDTVLVEKKAELLVRFDQPSSRDRPFMFHCHLLEHEDLGMMGQYVTA